jgi:hypothetical protein
MSKSESRKLPIVRSVRLSAEEAAAIDAAAEARGLGSSSFAREAMLRRRDVGAAEFVPVLGELGRVGNNLNQAIRLANAARRPADVAAIEATRSALLDLHRFVMAQAAA